jgi:hypothetical protein
MKPRSGSFFAAILRDARLRRAPQDEDFFHGKILDPHGEGAKAACLRTMLRIAGRTMRIGGLAAKKALILRRPPWAAVSKDGREETARTNSVHMR